MKVYFFDALFWCCENSIRSKFIVSGNYYFTQLSGPELPVCLLAFRLIQTQQQKHKRCLFCNSSGYYKFHLQMESILMLFCQLALPICQATHIRFIACATHWPDCKDTHCTIRERRVTPLLQEANAPRRWERLLLAPEAAELSLTAHSPSASLHWKYLINPPTAGLVLQ